jgi:CDP-glucose 4,6-dehydratase
MSLSLSFFKNKKIFITGHTGFKGSWLAYILYDAGAIVTGFALDPVGDKNHFNLLNLENKIHHIVGDIRDKKNLESAIQNCQPEFVFHLAAQALVRTSYEDPITTIESNVIGSANLLEIVRNNESIRSLVYITSDKCYENVEWEWGYRENDKLGGRDPYSASKAAAEIIFSSYQRSFLNNKSKLGAASVRAGNVIGGGDWAVDRIIPDCIRAIERNIAIQIRNPKSTRPWQHVLEPLSGYLLLAIKLYEEPRKFEGSWNFGPSTKEVKTVLSVTEKIISHMGKGEIQVSQKDNKLHEANLLQLNCDRAHQFLGWYPRWDVEKTLAETALWYKKVYDGEVVESVTKSQINEYFKDNL